MNTSRAALSPTSCNRCSIRWPGKKYAFWVSPLRQTQETRVRVRPFISPAKLLAEHAKVVISDPKALANAALDMAGEDGMITYIEDPYQAAAGCHALAVMTDWDLYRKLDYRKIYDSMIKPAFIFDGRNIIDHQKCFEIGFNVFPIGKPALSRL